MSVDESHDGYRVIAVIKDQNVRVCSVLFPSHGGLGDHLYISLQREKKSIFRVEFHYTQTDAPQQY